MNIEVNYKNPKKYKTAKYPRKEPISFIYFSYIFSKFLMSKREYKVEKINMENLKPPYMVLSNHMNFIDFEITAQITFPHRVNNVVTIDGFYLRPILLEAIGSIATRRFTTDIHLIRSISKVLKRGNILCMYPEARYSPAGIPSYIPETVGMLIKRNKVPVVAVLHRGNYLYAPFWNYRNKRKVPLHSTATQILTAEQIEEMTVEEINRVVKEALTYDEYKYQEENGILIKEDFRAEGLHKILYQCPHCMAESKMNSKGTEIFCEECGKRWTLREDGKLQANDGETEFERVPDWFLWERQQVKEQIENGTYYFEDEVEVFSLPRCWKFEELGKAKVRHTCQEGFVLEGEYNNAAYRIQRIPIQTNSLHIEYDSCYVKPFDCFDISTENDSFYCFPTKQNVITKLAFATEILYEISEKKARSKRKTKSTNLKEKRS